MCGWSARRPQYRIRVCACLTPRRAAPPLGCVLHNAPRLEGRTIAVHPENLEDSLQVARHGQCIMHSASCCQYSHAVIHMRVSTCAFLGRETRQLGQDVPNTASAPFWDKRRVQAPAAWGRRSEQVQAGEVLAIATIRRHLSASFLPQSSLCDRCWHSTIIAYMSQPGLATVWSC